MTVFGSGFVVLLVLGWAPAVEAQTNCGGHIAANCEACPEGNGATWCNGDCEWHSGVFGTSGKCTSKTPLLNGIDSIVPDIEIGQWRFLDWWMWSGCFCASAGIMSVYACAFYSQVVQRVGTVPRIFSIAGRERNLFSCFKEPHTCLQTTFCLPVVVAKNYNATEVMSFWPSCIFSFLSVYSPFYCIGVCVRAILSNKVQQRVGQQSSVAEAFFLNLFCMPCDVGRESLEVDAELGATITCCCNVWIKPRPVTEASNFASRLCGGGH